ncbi:DUF3800 domain-containing protein [bacterium]|nr:DUF3800 domain-containing protein [bacterium]MBU1638102.1 DUF3800 domain-containing protein [bacterium]MBU1920902.1 DUF3800 domain-containing protein [bacterium]
MYLVYVDESGNRTLKPKAGSFPVYTPQERFYVLLGCALLDHYWPSFEQFMTDRKLSVIQRVNNELGLEYPDSIQVQEVELKSTILRREKERSKHRFWRAISDEELDHLAESAYKALDLYKMEICAVIIDKEYLPEYYDWEKLHRKSYELLLERIEFLVSERHRKHKSMIIFDDVNTRINTSLVLKHDYFIRSGRTSGGRSISHIVQSPLFVNSRFANGIQIADICAYNVYRAFCRNDFEYKYFKMIKPYIYRSMNTALNRLDGLKVFPSESPLTSMNTEGNTRA